MLGDNYTDKTLVGSSEHTEVWRATRVDFGRLEAVKILRESHRNNLPLRSRFLQSNSTWAGLNHSNVVKIFNVDKEATAVITDYFEHNLQSVIARGAADEDSLRNFLRDCLNGLDYMHRFGFLHLNFKTTNVFADQQGLWKIADGHCHRIGSSEQLSPPSGTWKYLSPELMDEDSPLGTGSDIYSLGFLALEYLVGPQFDEHFGGTSNTNFDSNMAWHNWHCNKNQENPLARELCPHVSESLARVIDGMTRKQLANRLYRAPDVLKLLDQMDSETMPAAPRNGSGASPAVARPAAGNARGTTSGKSVCELMVLSGPLMGQVFSVAQNDFLLGGQPGSVIEFDAESYPGTVDRSLRMAYRDNAWEISGADLFLVNSQMAGRSKEIRSGDIVRFGTTGPDVQFIRKGSKPFSVAAYLSNVKTSADSGASSAPMAPGPPTIHASPSNAPLPPGAAGVGHQPAQPIAASANGAGHGPGNGAANGAANGASRFSPAPPNAPSGPSAPSAPGSPAPVSNGRRPQAPTAPAHAVARPMAPNTTHSTQPANGSHGATAATHHSAYQTGYGDPQAEQQVKSPGMVGRMMGMFSSSGKKQKQTDGENQNQSSLHHASAPGYAPSAPSAPAGDAYGAQSHQGQQTHHQGQQAETKKGLSKNQQNWLAGIGTGLVGLVAFILVPADVGKDAKADEGATTPNATEQSAPAETNDLPAADLETDVDDQGDAPIQTPTPAPTPAKPEKTQERSVLDQPPLDSLDLGNDEGEGGGR